MYLERLSEKNGHLFDTAFALYESAFPTEERRDLDEQSRVMKKDAYHFDLILDEGEFIGVMLYWETDTFVFLEHFTTLPALRGKGLGAKALGLLKAKNKTIILEIEDPVDEMTNRRFDFYKRNGFFMTPHHHIQAKYRPGIEDLMLKILSYPHAITTAEYLAFQDYMTKEIGILPQKSKEVIIRKAQKTDDYMQIAKLIYLSDAYIYPYWFDCIEDGQKVLAQMLDLPTLYNLENITVAVDKDGFIAGAIVASRSPILEDKAEIVKAFAQAGVKCDKRTDEIFSAYYEKMREDKEGLYLANIAVDETRRKRGIAAAMLASVVENEPLCHLECVQANIGAWRVYQRLGFRIVQEYPGVFDVPCYKMVKGGN